MQNIPQLNKTEPRNKSRRNLLAIALVLLLSLVAAACSNDAETSGTTETPAQPADSQPAESKDTESKDTAGETRKLDGVAADIFGGECAAANGKSLVVYSGRSEDLVQPVFDAFNCATGTEVEVRYGKSNELALLLSEEGSSTKADVYLSRSPGPVGFLESQNLLTTLDNSVLELLDEDYRSDDDTWVGFSGRQRVGIYNTDNVKADELPDSIFDLTDEKWRGRVAIPATNGSFVDWFTVFREQEGDDVAAKWLNDMAANDARYYKNNGSIVEAVGRGEIDFGLVNHYYNYKTKAAEGDAHRAENHSFAGDDFGSALMITAATVTEASQNKADGNELIKYLLKPEAQNYFTTSTFEYPLAKGVGANPALPPLEGIEFGSIDFDDLGGGLEGTSAIVEASGIVNQ